VFVFSNDRVEHKTDVSKSGADQLTTTEAESSAEARQVNVKVRTDVMIARSNVIMILNACTEYLVTLFMSSMDQNDQLDQMNQMRYRSRGTHA